MDVLFAPDWRNGVPYQRLLAEALAEQGVRVSFLQGYKRVFPLRRLLAEHPCDVLHLHWPEAYYPRKGDAWDWFRRARFAFDLRGATRKCVLATTAHNLHAHNRASEPFARRNTQEAHQQAGVVFAHSAMAKYRLIQNFDLDPNNVCVIPHGDLSVTLGDPLPQSDARQALGLGEGKLALIFGAVEPYKGQEEVISWWRKTQPDVTLAIVGKPITPEYALRLSVEMGGDPRIITRFDWLPDEQLRLWLSAADAAIFNYREIFTSGAANLARSWGLPMILPERLDTVMLDEPTPSVRRFSDFSHFGTALEMILKVVPDFAAAANWRQACSWTEVARLSAEAYRTAISRKKNSYPLSPRAFSDSILKRFPEEILTALKKAQRAPRRKKFTLEQSSWSIAPRKKLVEIEPPVENLAPFPDALNLLSELEGLHLEPFEKAGNSPRPRQSVEFGSSVARGYEKEIKLLATYADTRIYPIAEVDSCIAILLLCETGHCFLLGYQADGLYYAGTDLGGALLKILKGEFYPPVIVPMDTANIFPSPVPDYQGEPWIFPEGGLVKTSDH